MTFLDGSFVSAKKRGHCSWKNQAREGDKVDGTGRWPGHSFGSATSECFAGESHARRIDGGSGPSPVLGRGPSAAETETDNCRSCIRLEPAAGPGTEARHRVVGGASAQPAALVEAGRKKATSLQEKMGSQAHGCMLQNFRRLLVRQDRILTVYRGLSHFACLLITLRYYETSSNAGELPIV